MWQERVSLRRTLWPLLLAAGFVVLGIVILASGGWVAGIIGVVNIVIFGGSAAAMMLATLHRRGTVAIEVSPSGI